MAKVFPFNGIMYDKNIIDNLSKVMAPPYDVISPEAQEELYNKHPYNVIRLILGKEFQGDSDSNNKYLRAERFFTGWLKHGLLKEDDKPGIFIYEQQYLSGSKKLKRLGFFSLLRLEDLERGKVLPHEETFSKHKLDRLALKKACSANFDSIFAIFSDTKNQVEKILKKYSKRKPSIKVKDNDKVEHSIWKIDKKTDIKKIMKLMSDKNVFIADGHHRYEASLKYRDEMKEKYQKFSGEELYNHALVYFTPIEGKGLSIFPIHRLIRSFPDFDSSSFKEALKQYFDIEAIPFKKSSEKLTRKKIQRLIEKAPDEKHAMGMLLSGDNTYYILTLKEEKIIDKFVKNDKPKEWKKLDVTVLRSIIIDHILGLSKEHDNSEGQISYIKEEAVAVEQIMNKTCQIAFFLNATKVSQVIKIANDREKMPRKSTYFYPKLLSGLLMNRIKNDEPVPSF